MNGKKPTREQRKLIMKNKLDTYKWLVFKDTSDELHLIHKETGEKKVLNKR